MDILTQLQIQNFGEPFFMVIREGETLSEIKVRIQKKLQVPDEEFAKVYIFPCCMHMFNLYFIIGSITMILNWIKLMSISDFLCHKFLFWVPLFQWKFAFLSLGRPDYLEDNEIVFNRFQVPPSSASCQSTNFRKEDNSYFIYIPCYAEERCLWGLGAVSWFGTYRQCS